MDAEDENDNYQGGFEGNREKEKLPAKVPSKPLASSNYAKGRAKHPQVTSSDKALIVPGKGPQHQGTLFQERVLLCICFLL